MIKRLLSVTLACTAAAAALSATPGCASHNAAPSTQPVVDASNPHIQRAWFNDLQLKNDKLVALHLRDNRLFAYTDSNLAYVLSRSGGTINWSTQVGEQFASILPPLIVNDKVILPSSTRLFIYDQNGILDHAQDVGFAMHAPGVTDGRMIYIPSSRPGTSGEVGRSGTSRMACIDPTKLVGPVVWEFVVKGPISAEPALYENVLFAGTEGNYVYAVTTNRRPIWPLDGFAFQAAGRIVADVQADDFGVYVASTDSKLYCLDRMTGRIKWSYYAESPLSTPPTVTPDAVYQFAPNKGLVAIDKTAGAGNRTPRWTAPDAAQVLSVGSRRLYVRLRDNTIGALDRASGQLLWRGSHKYAQFVTNDDDTTLYVGDNDGKLYAYTPVGESPTTRPAPHLPPTRPANGTTPNGAMPTTPAQPAAPQQP